MYVISFERLVKLVNYLVVILKNVFDVHETTGRINRSV